jgi:serine/threonine protein kinase
MKCCSSVERRCGYDLFGLIDGGGRQQMVTPAKLAQVRAVHASSSRSAGEVPVVATQELGNVSALPTYERLLLRRAKRERVIEWLVRNGWSDVAARLVSDRVPQRRVTEQDGALDRGAELADVTRPIMPAELVEKVLRCTRMPGELFVEGLDQQWNVVASLAERRQPERHHVEPVVQVGAKCAAVDGGAQVLVGRGDHANVDARLIAPADALDHPVLDHAQQARLQIERKLPDLVEEHGPARSTLDGTNARARGAGERALLVPEQLALDERRRNRAAVDDDERSALARTRLMNRFGEQRLARSGLALDQNGRVGAGNPRQRLEDAPHRDRPANRPAEVIIGGERLLGVVLPVFEPQRRQAQLDRRARVDPRGFDAVLPKKNSVGGADIAKVRPALGRRDQKVIAGDSGIGEHQRVAISRTESDLSVRVEDDRATVGSIDHSYAHPPVRESVGAYANNVGRHDASIPRIMSDMVDAVSRRYEIVCRLNGGGMADLYLARTRGPGGFERLVVIKRLAKRLAAQPSAVQDMFDEARIAATLSHANIVQVNDIEIADGQVSIVMEFLHGHDVSHLLRRMKRAGEHIPLDQAVAIVLGVCAGLHHAHERVDSDGKPLDIVHRDVSPHNVFVTYDGAIKLVDFGIARASMRKGHTEHGFIKGKPGYIAPEAIRGRKPDRRTDVWGAAVLLYELTTGDTPYGPGTSFDDLANVTKHDAPVPSTVIADYPPELEAIVMRGLARDPSQRYPTADAMRVALDEFARARSLDLSPFRMSALMERVFAENLEAWRQSQRLGKSLAEHVAAFKTSGAHELIDLPGDPTLPSISFTSTNPLVTSDFLLGPITAPTRLLKRAEVMEPTLPFERDPVIEPPRPADPARPTPMAFESLTIPQASAFPDEATTSFHESPTTSFHDEEPVLTRRWRRPLAFALATPLVLFLSLLAWGSLDANHSATPVRVQAPSTETRATAVNDESVAQPISVEPIEPEPATAKPAAANPSIKTETAVAHAASSPAKKRPTAKSVKRKQARSVQPPRALPVSSPPQPAEDDLDALLPH